MNPLEARRRLLGRNVYKRTTEGNPAIAQGSLARMYPGITMQGWTEQDSTTGAQLFDIDGNELEPDTPTILRFKCHLVEGESYTITNNGNDNITFKISDYRDGYNSVAIDRFTGSRTFTMHRNENVPESSEQFLYFWIHQGEQTVEVNDISMIKDLNIMINSGPEALPWEPYTGGASSPSPDYPQEIVSAGNWNEDTQKWEYGIELAGKNLLDEKSVAEVSNVSGITIEWLEDEKCFLLNGTCISTLAFALTDINLKGNIGSVYTVSVHNVSGEVSVPDGGAFVAFFGVNDSPASGGAPKENWIASYIENEVPSTGVLNRKYINTFWFYITEGVSLVNCKLNVMLEQGNTATEYEQYKSPQTVTLTADRPLTKWDRLEKRNGQWGWVYKSAEIVLDGSEDEVWEIYIESTTKLISFQIDLLGDTKGSQVSLCDKYINKYGAWYMDEYGIYSDHEITKYKYFRPPSAEVETVEQWTDWLAQNPLTVWYETAEETFVSLSETEQEQMNALYTFRPTTVLSNDRDCNMSLTYKEVD